MGTHSDQRPLAGTYDGPVNQKTSAAFPLITYNGINQTADLY